MVGGAYYVVAGSLDYRALSASIPIGLLVAAVLLANNVRDVETDARAGVRTLAVILGRPRAVRLYQALLASAYAIQAVLVASGILPPLTLATLLTLPRAVGLIKLFEKGAPPNADPLTARLVQDYGVALIAGLLAAYAVEALA